MSAGEEAASYEISDSRLVRQPVASICVLVYNHEDCLAETLESVLAQQAGFPFEVLIGEDCSTDGSREIALRYLEKHPESIRIITSDENVGAFANARRLLLATRGEYIASLDGDDYWLPGKLAAQVAFLRENPGCVAVYANAIAVDGAGRELGVFNDVGTARFDLGALLRRGNFLNSSSLVYGAELKPGLLGMQGALMDYMVHLHIARHGLIGHLGEPMVAYRVNSSGSMVANDNARVRELYWQAIQSVPRELVTDDDYARGLADFMRRVVFRATRKRDLSLLKHWLPRVIDVSPYGRLRTIWLVATNVLRMAVLELSGLFPGRVRVLYRR